MDDGDSAGHVFRLHTRCYNCRYEGSRNITVPPGDDAPDTVEDLVESQFLARQQFFCAECDSSIGCIIAITMPECVAA